MELLIKKIAIKAKVKSPDLLTRPVGQAVYKEAQKKLSILKDHEVLVLDFEDIGVMDSSFIDEFIISLMKDAIEKDPPFYLKARNIYDVNQINLESVIQTYSKYRNQRIALVVNELTRGNTFLIGDLTPMEHDVISYIFLHKEASETELSKLLNVSMLEIKKTIDQLYKIRVIRKDNERILAV